jgi:glycosyltransferase involved in cell wall biosynthesis
MNRMIALDATYSLARQPRGVAVYSARLIEWMCRLAPDERFLLFYRSNPYFRALSASKPPNASRRLLAEKLCFLWRNRVSVFHGLGPTLPHYRFRRMVTTFHDILQMTGEYFSAEFRQRMAPLLADAAARSDHIIADSRFTAEQLTAHLRYPSSQITVVPLGVEAVPEFSAEEMQAFRSLHGLEGQFLLCVGALEARKNIVRLVEAFEQLSRECMLVLAGSPSLGFEKIQERIAASPARARILQLGYVDARSAALLYRTATALAFPSLEEGFGLPPLEAMSAGLPVVAANASATPEGVGDAALLVNPLDSAEIAAALERVMGDSECRERLIRAGRQRAAEFTWQKTAERTLAVYRQLV